jgi:hypothetical protein
VAEQAARHGLERLLAPALGLLDTRAALGLGREQRRVGPHLVEEAGDPARALDVLPVQLERRDREPSKPARRTSSGCGPGISVTSRCGMRLWATIAAPAAAAFEIGMT